MYCPTCGNEIAFEVKYCNRCGANLAELTHEPPTVIAPVKLTAPTIVLGLTIVCGLGVIFAGIGQFALIGVNPVALTWMVLFSLATLFGSTAMLLRFWSRLYLMQRDGPQIEAPKKPKKGKEQQAQLPARLEPVPSVTEHTTRTFTPSYKGRSEQ